MSKHSTRLRLRRDCANAAVLASALATSRYGSISVRTLREFYGSFAPHCADGEKLSEVLTDLDGGFSILFSQNKNVAETRMAKMNHL